MSSTRCRSATCDGPHVRCVSAEGRRSWKSSEASADGGMRRIPALVGLIVAMACVFGSGTPTLC
jgi:hypothetical protein